jgi:hypothetical protein
VGGDGLGNAGSHLTGADDSDVAHGSLHEGLFLRKCSKSAALARKIAPD